ncbi:MAG TPA: hypothetical protein VFQ15_00985, partial [Jiangellaceae bacterium]|nr:hypothetical protein [Jiangellaceae bacterium]
TVKKALASDAPPRYRRRARKGSVVDAVEPGIRRLLAEFPDMPSTVIMERIGWTRGRTVLFDRIAELRPLFRVPDPVSRTDYQPGELAQCDLWFPPVDIPAGHDQLVRPPVLVMVSGYSRIITARMIPSRQSEDLLAGHWALAVGLGPGAAGAGLGQRVRRRDVESRPPAADRGDAGLPRRARDHDHPVPPAGPGGQGGWSNAPTATSRPRSCPGAASPDRPTSTPNSATG